MIEAHDAIKYVINYVEIMFALAISVHHLDKDIAFLYYDIAFVYMIVYHQYNSKLLNAKKLNFLLRCSFQRSDFLKMTVSTAGNFC